MIGIAERERERSRFLSFRVDEPRFRTFSIVKLIGGSYFCGGMAELSTESVEERREFNSVVRC